jgi:hypothetical protein
LRRRSDNPMRRRQPCVHLLGRAKARPLQLHRRREVCKKEHPTCAGRDAGATRGWRRQSAALQTGEHRHGREYKCAELFGSGTGVPASGQGVGSKGQTFLQGGTKTELSACGCGKRTAPVIRLREDGSGVGSCSKSRQNMRRKWKACKLES